MSTTLASTLSLLSAVIVAVLAHLFSERRKRKDELAEMRLKAYTDFINATTRLANTRRLGEDQDELEVLLALNDAKIRVCISAEAAIVEELIKFWQEGGTLEKEREVLAFTRLCLLMRKSLGNKLNDVVSMRISDLLFKLEPSSYSFKSDNQKSHEN